jgi:hypothetical protein
VTDFNQQCDYYHRFNPRQSLLQTRL